MREGNQPSLLDLLFIYSEYEISNLEYDSPIGLSDHCILNFKYVVKSQINNVVIIPQVNFYKSRLEKIKIDLHRWDESWSLFMGYYEDTINKNVPVRPAKVNKDKLP